MYCHFKKSSEEDEHLERTRGRIGKAETHVVNEIMANDQSHSERRHGHASQSAWNLSNPEDYSWLDSKSEGVGPQRVAPSAGPPTRSTASVSPSAWNLSNPEDYSWLDSKSEGVGPQRVAPSAGPPTRSTASVSPIKPAGLELFYKWIMDEVTEEAAKVFESANIDEAQFLTLTREDVNELMPGLSNFQTRKKIMNLIMEKNVKSSGSNMCVHSGKVQQLLLGNEDLRKDPLVSGSAVKNVYRILTDMEADFQKCLGVLQQQIQVVAELSHQTKREEMNDLKQDKCIQTDLPANILDEHKDHEGFPAQPNHPPMQVLKIETLITGKTFGAEITFLDKLSQNLRSMGIDLQKQACEYNSDKVLLLFCPVISRIGTDIDAVIQNISPYKKVILVVMHHSRKKVLSESSRLVNKSNVLETVDCLYYETDGFYHCDANTKAITSVSSALLRYQKTT
ncbi:uncharacterized protein LOC117402916 isoform X2 [Acipenser ruthenus]|uniref:uncharacterized protein LOC117402916 isoform X2 n=1 Tax=Acipenser ruthenus TaxID=7906 RepID=UPI00145AD29B|nr:uncharacterized protein LOC117402916 isoform X2 [Acipenser ruthenus]